MRERNILEKNHAGIVTKVLPNPKVEKNRMIALNQKGRKPFSVQFVPTLLHSLRSSSGKETIRVRRL